jgi:hypothetical protein
MYSAHDAHALVKHRDTAEEAEERHLSSVPGLVLLAVHFPMKLRKFQAFQGFW